jgi:SPP1 family predicted phage head-tail adaptor
MQAGRLRHLITIQNFTTTRDSSGQPVEEWVDGANTRAEVKGISGRELVAAGAETAEATVRVWMRYRHDVSAAPELRLRQGHLKGTP